MAKSLNAQSLAKSMIRAAAGVLKKDWPDIKSYAELEMHKLAATIVMIRAQYTLGQMTKEEARLLMEIQRNAMRSVMLTIEGLGVIAVEKSINAALKVVRDAVNAAIGFALL